MCGLQRLAYARTIAAGHAVRAEPAHAGITRARPTCPYTIGTASPSTTSLGPLTQRNRRHAWDDTPRPQQRNSARRRLSKTAMRRTSNTPAKRLRNRELGERHFLASAGVHIPHDAWRPGDSLGPIRGWLGYGLFW